MKGSIDYHPTGHEDIKDLFDKAFSSCDVFLKTRNELKKKIFMMNVNKEKRNYYLLPKKYIKDDNNTYRELIMKYNIIFKLSWFIELNNVIAIHKVLIDINNDLNKIKHMIPFTILKYEWQLPYVYNKKTPYVYNKKNYYIW